MSYPLKDPFRYQWFYFLHWHARDEEDHRRHRAEAFQKVLESACRWACGNEPVLKIPLESYPSPQVSRRLAHLPWKTCEGQLRELEARTLLDCFYLQVGQAFSGAAAIDAFKQLTPYSITPEAENTPQMYLGEAASLGGILGEEQLPENWPEVAAEILRQEFSSANPTAEEISQTALPAAGGVLIPFLGENRQLLLLLYPRRTEEKINWLVYLQLPQLLLSRVKYRYLARRYYNSLWPETQNQEQRLDALLKKGLGERLSLGKLETLSKQVSREHAAFIESVSTAEEDLVSLKVSIRNLHLLLEDPWWEPEVREQGQRLWEDMQLFQEQMETDLRYWKITRQQSELALQSLLTVAGVRGAQWERRITLVLGLFAAIGLAQVFPHSPIPGLADSGWQAGIIGLGILIVLLASWLLSRR